MSEDFSKNHPPPFISPKINRALRDIAGLTPTGKPILRLVYGQAWEGEYAHTWEFCGEVAHRYRHHWEREWAMAEPVYDLVTGKVNGYGKHYFYGEVLPACLLVPVELKKSIGVPRWYFELAAPVIESEWNVKVRGPVPEGLVVYQPLTIYGILMRIEMHDRWTAKVGDEEFPTCCAEKIRVGKTCYGRYRAPTMSDVDMVRRAFNENQGWRKDFFAPTDSTKQLWESESALKDHVRAEAAKDAQQADDMEQAMTMLSDNRLTGTGSGMDLTKYSTHHKVAEGTELWKERTSDASSA